MSPEDYIPGTNGFCYNEVLTSVTGGPTTAQLLVMFRENFVEHKGKVYASIAYHAPERDDLSVGGLYEVIDDDTGSCVTLNLIYEDDNLGQIVASSQFDPIEIIGVSGSTIYGYYPESGGTMWSRKQTVWGDAKDGSLSVAQRIGWDGVSGLSSNDSQSEKYKYAHTVALLQCKDTSCIR